MKNNGMFDENVMQASFDYTDKKKKHIQKKLTSANVVFASCKEGVLILTTNGKMRHCKKIFEVHYKIAGARMGEIGVIEDVGNLIINVADILNGHKLLSSVNDIAKPVSKHLSESFKQFTAPMIFKVMLAEVGDSPEDDDFIELPCDGYIAGYKDFAILGEESATKHSGNIYSLAKAALTALYKDKKVSGEDVLLSDVMRPICGLFGSQDPFEVAVIYRAKPEGEKCRHFARLSAEELEKYIK